jgi:spermidine synthase
MDQVRETDCQQKSYVRLWSGTKVADFHTKCAHVQVLDTADFGRTIFLDGEIQSSSADQEFYHERLVQPIFRNGPKHNILIVGGGECATLAQVLKDPDVDRVTMVDYDEEFVGWCKDNLESWHHNSWADRRVTILHEDIYKYIDKCSETFDAIIVDMTDISVHFHPEEEAALNKLISGLKSVMEVGGTIRMYVGMWIRHKSAGLAQALNLLKSFGRVEEERVYIPTFGTGESLFVTISDTIR